MTVRELREKYLRFFESKGHVHFPSGSLIPFDVTGRLDESLLFNGAGMVQFKPYFRGVAEPSSKRLTTCQKCVRTGDIETVGDTSHLTFFEMLGNFSFGDYFKKEAIAFSWEFLTSTEWLGLDPARLVFTIFLDDDEAFAEWSKWIAPTGMNPAWRIFRLDDETNYWPAGSFTKGPPGPCGPNSEMFYWVGDGPAPSGEYSAADYLRDDAAGNWLEIWNDVFISYEWKGSLKNSDRPSDGYVKESMPDLPFKSIDTGMGLDRTAAVLAGLKSVYDTDAFQPIIRKIEAIADAQGFSIAYGQDAEKDRAIRIISDHIRTAVFCISDGILPGNNGRGYVLRRLIRRAVLKGVRSLGFQSAFFHEVYEGVVGAMGAFYTELGERRATIVETLRNEEALFRRTLNHGVAMLEDQLAKLEGKTYEGAAAFMLYDTYGFPLEVTIELCGEVGVAVDIEGYEIALKAAQELSRGSQDRESVYGGVGSAEESATPDAPETTNFLGYHSLASQAKIVRQRGNLVALDQTPFYAESGGQAGDQGTITLDGTAHEVIGTTKSSGIWWHELATSLSPASLGKTVQAEVARQRRASILRNHTATHLLQAALRQVVGTHVTQAGSAVGPDSLRFDFTHSKGLTAEEIDQVERIVNREALQNTDVTIHVDLPIAEAKAKGAMALFGEKYGNLVRMVEIGEFSKELCGGTHVRSTGEIGLFKIISEASAASGVRRIEAITGEAAFEWVQEQNRVTREAASLLKSPPKDLLSAIERVVEHAKEEKKKREKAESALARGGSGEDVQVHDMGSYKLAIRQFSEMDPKIVAEWIDDTVARDMATVVLASLVNEDKVMFTIKVGKQVGSVVHAGNLIREVAKVAGGGGGGRPDFATAGGKDASKVGEALARAVEVLKG